LKQLNVSKQNLQVISGSHSTSEPGRSEQGMGADAEAKK
jgi:hypothetical protein